MFGSGANSGAAEALRGEPAGKGAKAAETGAKHPQGDEPAEGVRWQRRRRG